MSAQDSLAEGNLDEALERLQDQVRKEPANVKHRIFLFQLLAVLGRWDRALTQLNVTGEMDASTLPMCQTYRELLRCELLRAEIFSGKRSPLVFGEPEEWIALMIQALQLTAEGKQAQSQEIRGQALEAAPATAGTADDAAFEWISDADTRLGPILEGVVNGRYYWIPFHRIREIQLEEPTDLRDVVWTPVTFTWANGGEVVGMIPTRYAGTESSDDGLLRLSRKTEWHDAGDDVFTGLGQRMLATDTGELPLMDVRSIRLDSGDAAGDAAPTDAASGDAPG